MYNNYLQESRTIVTIVTIAMVNKINQATKGLALLTIEPPGMGGKSNYVQNYDDDTVN